MLIAVLFIIAKNWKSLTYPLTDEWINWLCICTIEWYSKIKRNELLKYNNMDECQNDYAEWEKPNTTTYCIIPFTWNSRKYKLIYSDKNKAVVSRLLQKAIRELFGVMEMFCISLWTCLYYSTYLEFFWTVQLKWLILLYLNYIPVDLI